MMDFSGKVVLITGGSSGIGLALAHRLADQGARIGLIGTNTVKLADAQEALRKSGATVANAPFNVADEQAWPRAVEHLEAQLGPVDGLFLNAGVGSGSTPTESGPSSIWRWIWETNVLGTVYGLRTCLPGMKARGQPGHVLITSSIAALAALPGLAPYASSKAAVIALAETLRAELAGTSIGVSVLIPAAVRTDFSATSARLAPTDFKDGRAAQVFDEISQVLQQGVDPADVAAFVLQRIAAGAFYIFTHPDFRQQIAARQRELLGAIPSSVPLSLEQPA
jgi:NAD(P)-dependent dehydrogenase (short-subunit alcohol dehydrogenase family)